MSHNGNCSAELAVKLSPGARITANAWQYVFLAPLAVFLVAIFFGPVIYVVSLSLTDLSLADVTRSAEYIGLQNYVRAVKDQVFVGSLGRSCVFATLCVLLQLALGLGIAEALHARPRLRRYVAPLLFVPSLLPGVIVGLYWRLLLQGEFGLLSHYLPRLGLTSFNAPLSSGNALLVVALVDVWQWTPFVAVLLLAARGSLPHEPIEAAWLDGASRLRGFWDVTLRALAPTISFIALLRGIDSFKDFDKVFILTGGGPGTATELSSLYIWRTAFRTWDLGYAAALSVLVYIVIYTGARVALFSKR